MEGKNIVPEDYWRQEDRAKSLKGELKGDIAKGMIELKMKVKNLRA